MSDGIERATSTAALPVAVAALGSGTYAYVA